MELSCVCKMFYGLVRKGKFYQEKNDHSWKIFKNKSRFICYYEDKCLCFACALVKKLKDYVPKRNLHFIRFIVKDKLFHSTLPFRVWNHMFLCSRCQYEKDMCRFCTKVYGKHRKISSYINDNLNVQIYDYIPVQLRYWILIGGELTLFVHSSVVNRQSLILITVSAVPCFMNLWILLFCSGNVTLIFWQ